MLYFEKLRQIFEDLVIAVLGRVLQGHHEELLVQVYVAVVFSPGFGFGIVELVLGVFLFEAAAGGVVLVN